MQERILEIRGVSKNFENVKALSDINFHIGKGEIFGLLGPNGAGKTTLLRIINRIFLPDKGEIIFNGEPLEEKHLPQIGYMPEERGLYRKMTVEEHCVYFGQLRGMTRKEAEAETYYWLRKFDILTWANKKIEELSKGMQQKVQFIITVLHKPDLLILDEPFSGFDPVNTELIIQTLYELKKNGTTIILSTHNMHSAESLCNKIVLINKGKVLIFDEIEKIKRQFDEQIYSVVFQGVVNLENTGDFEIIKQETANNQTNYLIKLRTDIKTFLNYAFGKGDVLEFKHQLPDLHKIFIQLVENTNTAEQ